MADLGIGVVLTQNPRLGTKTADYWGEDVMDSQSVLNVPVNNAASARLGTPHFDHWGEEVLDNQISMKADGNVTDWDVYWQLKNATAVVDGADLHGTPQQDDAAYLDGATVLRGYKFSPIRDFNVKFNLGETI